MLPAFHTPPAAAPSEASDLSSCIVPATELGVPGGGVAGASEAASSRARPRMSVYAYPHVRICAALDCRTSVIHCYGRHCMHAAILAGSCPDTGSRMQHAGGRQGVPRQQQLPRAHHVVAQRPHLRRQVLW